jgi:hypothetical protein
VLTQISQRNARNLAPLVPQVAILIALGVSALPRLPRTAVAAASMVVLLLQWTGITFDGAQPLHMAGRALWVIDEYAMPPASGRTASGFNVAPEVLAEVAGGSQANASESLGVLVNANFLHRGALRYLATSSGQDIIIGDLTEAGASWQNVIDSQWIAVKDGNNNNAELASLAQIERIEKGDPLFDLLYSVARTWQLPNGETLTLYHREGPGFPDADDERAVSATNLATQLFANNLPETPTIYGYPDLAVWVGRMDPPGNPHILPYGWDGSDDTTLADLQGTVAVVLDSHTPSLEAWFDQRGVRAATFADGDLAVVYFAMGISEAEEIPVSAAWDAPTPALLALRSSMHSSPGGVIRVESQFSADAPGIKWSVRLEDATGMVVATNDRPVLAQDRFGLLVPAHVAAGQYRVVARLYDEATLAPIPSTTGVVDVPLFTVTIQ